MTTDTAISAEQIENWLCERLAKILATNPEHIDTNQAFIDFNLDSSVSVTITNEFSNWLGTELPVTVFWEYPTIRLLASAIESGAALD